MANLNLNVRDHPGGFTVLHTTNRKRLTKLNQQMPDGLWVQYGFDAPSEYYPEEFVASDLRMFALMLSDLQKCSELMIVRGALNEATRLALGATPRLKVRRRKNEPFAAFVEVDRQWIMIDVDSWPLSDTLDIIKRPEEAVRACVRGVLPPAFHDADLFFQYSSSAGIKAHMRVHLFFWMNIPASNSHIRRVLKEHAPGVDTAPFNAVQPHYIADPIFEGGIDPLPVRMGFIEGHSRSVILPAPMPPVARRSKPVNTPSKPVRDHGSSHSYTLSDLGDHPGGGGFHVPLRAATLRYARQVSRMGGRDDDALITELGDAIRSADNSAHPDISSYQTDAYLIPLINGAFNLISHATPASVTQPAFPLPVLNVAEARTLLSNEVGAFMNRTLTWLSSKSSNALPEHGAVSVDVGVGKSVSVRREVAQFIAVAKSRSLPHRVLWLVPTHQLSDETHADMHALGIHAAIWRGRDAPNPQAPGQSMCQDLEAVKDAQRVSADVEASVCGNAGGRECPFRRTCGYQAQRAAAKAADVLIVAHQMLFNPTPASDGFGLAVVDESFWQAGLLPARVLNLDGLANDVLRHPVKHWDDDQWTLDESANSGHVILWEAIETMAKKKEVGAYITRDDLLFNGITPEALRASVANEWARKVRVALVPGMSMEERRRVVGEATSNSRLPRRAALLVVLRDFLDSCHDVTARVQVEQESTPSGVLKVLTLLTHSEVVSKVNLLPILILDATLPEQIVRVFLPNMKLLAEVRSTTPHQYLIQVSGGWGKSSLIPSSRASPSEKTRRQRVLADLRDFINLHSGGDCLVVTYQALECYLQDIPNVQTRHFNAIAGLDRFKNVKTVFVIGRPQPPSHEVRRMVIALKGRVPANEEASRTTCGALMRDGTGVEIGVRTFHDPELEEVRRAITDAQVIQAIGRARGVGRDATCPVKVYVMADVALPFCVDEVVRWADISPGPRERMALRGVVFESPTDASLAFPDLFVSAGAAKKALNPRGEVISPSRNIYRADSLTSSFQAIEYRPEGAGRRPRIAHVRPDLVAQFSKWLARLIGPLAQCALMTVTTA